MMLSDGREAVCPNCGDTSLERGVITGVSFRRCARFRSFCLDQDAFDEVTCVDWTRVTGGAASMGRAGAAPGATGETTEETEDAGLVEVVLKGIGWIILALLTP